MRAIQFFDNNHSQDLLHIETVGCIINIRVNLHNVEGKEITSIEILPDKYAGEEWDIYGTVNNITVRRRKDGN